MFSRHSRPAHARHGQLALRIEVDLAAGEHGRCVFVASADDEALAVNTAVELAWHLAEEYGRKVLLVDGSFAGTGVSASLGSAPTRGLMDLLALGRFDKEAIERFATATAHPGIAVLPPGRGAHGELGPMRLEVVRQFMESATREFDFVIVQGPVVRRGRRALVFAGLADLALLVVIEEVTRLRHLEESHAVLVNCGAAKVCLVLASDTADS